MAYILLLAFLCVMVFVKVSYRFYFGVAAIALYLVIGSANGMDWLNYERFYHSDECCSDLFLGFYEPVFIALLAVFKSLGMDFWAIRTALAAFFVFSIFSFARYCRSRELVIFAIFSTIGYWAFVDQLRQGLAIAIIMLSYRFLERVQLKQFFAGVVCASLLHFSAFAIVVPVFFKLCLKNTSVGVKYLSLVVFVSLLSCFFVFSSSVVSLLSFLPLIGDRFFVYSQQSDYFQVDSFLALGRIAGWCIALLLTCLGPQTNFFAISGFVTANSLTMMYFTARFGYYLNVDAIKELSRNFQSFSYPAKIAVCALLFAYGLRPAFDSIHSNVVFNYESGILSDLNFERDERCAELSAASDHSWVLDACGK